MSTQKNHISYVQVLKAISCFAIVLLHTVYGSDGSFDNSNLEHYISVSIRNCMTWAVPCFVMISGALLLGNGKPVEYKKIFSKYIPRMIIAIVVFTILFRIIDIFIFNWSFGISFFTECVKEIFTDGSWSHMWYLYMMIAIYIMLPVFKKITESSNNKDILYLLVVYGVFLSVVPTIESIGSLSVGFYITVFSVYPFYFFAGYAINNGIIKIKKSLSIVIILFSALVMVLLTIISDIKSLYEVHSFLTNYSFVLTAIASLAIFALFSQIDFDRNKVLFKVADIISRCSFGIYLIHMIFLKYIFLVMKFNPYSYGGILMLIALSVIVFVMSFTIVYILKKIPFVKNII